MYITMSFFTDYIHYYIINAKIL